MTPLPPFTASTASLREHQVHFTRMLTRLLTHAEELGYGITLGDAYRDPRAFGPQGTNLLRVGGRAPYGEARSAHKERLAIDLNLFRDGRFLTATSDHEPLGLFWEGMGGAWGGRFQDGNHYSLEY